MFFPDLDLLFSTQMARFYTDEEILKELQDQQEAEDDKGSSLSSDLEENFSEVEDNADQNDDIEADDFEILPEDCVPVQEQDFYESHEGTPDDDRDFVLGKDGESIWTNKSLLPSHRSRTPARNIVTHLPGPKRDARDANCEASLFSLFLTDSIIEDIVVHTNDEMLLMEEKACRAPKYTKQWYTGPTSELELKALFGLLYFSGVLRNSTLNLHDMFSKTFGPPLFRCAMTEMRFKYLLRALRFDSKTTRQERQKTDKFAPFRELWNKFCENCKNNYTPSEYLTIDETLLSFRGRSPFKMFIPSKPDKYGLKIISLCDARSFYFLDGIPYIGKGTTAARKKGDLMVPTQYVLKLSESVKNTNRNITVDNWFTSSELAEELGERKLTLVGTLRKNKTQIPLSFISTTGVPLGTSRFLFQDDKMMVSFNDKPKKNVILLSTMHDEGLVNPETRKPEIVELYNLTKGGVDVYDKLCHTYTTKRASRRWPMRYFYCVLDTAAINCYVVYKLKLNTCTRAEFLKSLAYSLTEPHMKMRVYNTRLPRTLRAEIRNVLNLEEPELTERTPEPLPKKRRCDFCTRAEDRKTKNVCKNCNKSICSSHEKTVRFCIPCSEND